MTKAVPFQTIQFNISMLLKCKYTVYLSKNISITGYSVYSNSSNSNNSV